MPAGDVTAGLDALHRTALQHDQAGETKVAVEILRQVTERDSGRVQAYFDRACMLGRLGRNLEAASSFQEVLRQQPKHADAWHNLALCLQALGRSVDAQKALERALRIEPRRADTLLVLRCMLRETGRKKHALRCLELAVQVSTMDASPARVALAQTLTDVGRIDEAADQYLGVIKADESCAEAWIGLGHVREDQGDAQSAERCYRRALTLCPGQGFAIGRLLSLRGVSAEQPLIDLARQCLTWEHVPDDARALVGYGLGKALEAKGMYSDAFAAYAAANAARRRVTGTLDRAALAQRVDDIIARYEVSRPASILGASHSALPVFVVGLPRSGTTLVEQILASHPLVHGAGELPDLAELAADMEARSTIADQPKNNDSANACFAGVEQYLAALAARSRVGAVRAIDKAPLNFFHLGLVERLFPQSRVIHCVRDPRDVCFSIFAENFAPSQKYSTDLHDIAYYWSQYRRLMTYWTNVLSIPILQCRYEDTVTDLEATARRLCEFVGVPFDSRCLEFHTTTREVRTPSRWQVRRSIYRSSLGRWKRFADKLHPLVANLQGLGWRTGQST